jgi:TonB-dependent starch-binding outer membrane protein SusC
MKLKILLFIMIAWTMPRVVLGQQLIAGKVVDSETNDPLPGVNIVLKGTTKGTITDGDGNFSITAQSSDILVFSFLGYAPQEVLAGAQSTLNVSLKPDISMLNEVVITGYQTLARDEVTGAVGIANVDELIKESVPSLTTALQGRMAGIQVNSDGTPGGGNTNIFIRGLNSTGENRPLFVVDGMPTMEGINMINPKDIETIQVLKDAASASIYGARANNGVIVITTKQGSGEKVKLTFDASGSVQMLRNRIDVLNSYEWGQVYWQAQRNAGRSPEHPQYGNGPEPILPSFIDDAKIIPAASTDWVDESFDPSLMQNYNIGISNSTEKSNVYFNVSYLDQEGIMKYTGFERLSIRLNTSFKLLNDKLTIGENLLLSRTKTVAAEDLSFTHQILFQHPLVPVYDINGDFGGPTNGLGDKRNPIAALYQNKDNATKGARLFGNLFAEIELLKGLSFRTNIGLDYNPISQKIFKPMWKEGTRSYDKNELTVINKYDLNTTWTNTLNYVRRSEDHSINALVGMETNTGYYEDFGARRENFLLENLDYQFLNAGTGAQTNFNGARDWTLLSYMAKADYAYKGKYLASATIRRDASSRLDPNNNYDIFPAASIGWVLSQEPFMANVTWLSNLKIRGGYGATGNQAIGEYSAYTFYVMDLESSRYNLSGDNSSATAGYKILSHGNPVVRWETAKQMNIGADIALFNDKLNIVGEYYTKRNEDILVDPPRIGAEGEGRPPFLNSGIMENKGWDLDLSYKGNIGDLSFKAGVNVGRYKNNVVRLGDGNDFFTGTKANVITTGQPISSYYGYIADGLFKSVEEIANHADQGLPENETALGRIKYRDLDNDGVITPADRTYIGNPHPSFTYGINLEANYKQFDLSLLFDGVQGRDIYNVFREMTDFTYWNFNYGARTLDAWSPENPNSDIPAVSTNDINGEFRSSTYFVDDGSYFRLKSVALGYTLPESIVDKLKIGSARIYFQAQNIFTVTKYIGMDYEVGARGPYDLGIDSQFYPHTKNVTLGLNVSF